MQMTAMPTTVLRDVVPCWGAPHARGDGHGVGVGLEDDLPAHNGPAPVVALRLNHDAAFAGDVQIQLAETTTSSRPGPQNRMNNTFKQNPRLVR